MKRWPARPGVPARRPRVEEVAGGLEVAGHRPGDDGRVALGDHQAEVPAGAQHPGDGRQRGGGLVDDLEHAVAQDQVDAAGLDQAGEVPEVALLAGDPVGDAALAGPAVEGRQGVGARVDDPDVVAELGQRDGEPAGAAADVDDPSLLLVERTRCVEELADRCPHHAGADGLAALAG